jgi:hypothetical protein
VVKYTAWAAAVLSVCVAVVASACYFGKPLVLLGLVALVWLPHPFDEGGE